MKQTQHINWRAYTQVTSRTLYDPQFEHDACGVGFTADLTGKPTQRIVRLALQALIRLAHRGATDADADTGDGAGLLCQVPMAFLRQAMSGRGRRVPDTGPLVVGMIFLPPKPQALAASREIIEAVLQRRGFQDLGWRVVPTDDGVLGGKAARTRPEIRQVVASPPADYAGDKLERLLFVARKEMEARLKLAGLTGCFICSLSHRTIVYKGLLNAAQLAGFYPDLHHPQFKSTFAIFHQRYSTNTFPNWSLAQPFRLLAHNGEINTVQGNRNWMRTREMDLDASLWRDEAGYLKPIIWAEGSDSASLDNAAELLVRSGRGLLHAMMMLVPEAHECIPQMDPAVRAFYLFHEALMEPWDGPASLAFSDGVVLAAALDRNGLRPLRYVITDDGLVILASEVGVVDVEPERIVEKGRLGPGQAFGVDLRTGRLLRDADIKQSVAARQDYATWVKRNLRSCPPPSFRSAAGGDLGADDLLRRQQAFGYSVEDIKYILSPMARDGKLPVGSMGDDTPLAPFSTKPRLLYSYFKQRFAQVTNPPIDPLREALVMGLDLLIGRWGNFLEESPQHAGLIKLNSPILVENQFSWLMNRSDFPSQVLDATFAVEAGAGGLRPAIEALCRKAERVVRQGTVLLFLSDRAVGPDRAAIPMLLAVGAVHHHLIRAGLRLRTSLLVESAEPRQTHDIACLIGYGASAVFPYLAFEVVRQLVCRSNGVSIEVALEHYVLNLGKELLKIMSKMGISTLNSYCGAQIFEAVGLDQSLIDAYFTNTPSPVGGVRLEDIAADALHRHERGFRTAAPRLQDEGQYRYRRTGEYHSFNPEVIRALHKAMNADGSENYRQYSRLVRDRPTVALRDLFVIRSAESVPFEDVESAERIVRRFCTSAMSHGALSREAHETIAKGMNRLGAKSNSGEGGEAASRYRMMTGVDSANSVIKQVASARFGVTPAYLVSARELEIKMAQGAKPGEGGQLPGHKVTAEIAGIRHSTPGTTLISPPPHHDIYSIEDLAQLIHDLRRINPRARIAVKLVSEAGVGTIAAGVAKAHADIIHISGHVGGTGASPLGSIKHAGAPWELGLAEAHQVLKLNGLRDRVRLRVDGGLQTGRDVIIAALLGADEFGFGTAALAALGCVMARQCHLNTCPVGIATQRAELRQRFKGTPEMVAKFFLSLAEEVREMLAQLGARHLADVVGRTDMLSQVSVPPANVRGVFDLSPLLASSPPAAQPGVPVGARRQAHANELDDRLFQDARVALKTGRSLRLDYTIQNTDRTLGARLAGEVARRWGDDGLPEGMIDVHLRGTAGQSFGAFCLPGMRLVLEGDANDYVGKSMAGGQLIIFPPANVPFARGSHTIIGNTVLYGATGGELFAAGAAGERFAVRNSGALAVVEGLGDHGCEYMTGGIVVVLGPVGKNFAAGMTGGVAYVLDDQERLTMNCNRDLVQVNRLIAEEEKELFQLIQRHLSLTGSFRAAQILNNWQGMAPLFRKVAAPSPAAARTEIREAMVSRVVEAPGPRPEALADGR